jgi:geranylgeranyl diphosphate synthase, type II
MKELATLRRAIDERLISIAESAGAPTVLRPPLRATLASPGKRVRGLLLVSTGLALGAREQQLIDAACAFEMIHASSLILDDLPSMDDAEIRRGEPALHRAFGEDLAVLTAVALLNHAYALVSASRKMARPRRWDLSTILEDVVEAVGWDGSIGGEAVDLHSEGRALDFKTLEYIHSRKTGALFVACAGVGAMLANCTARSLSSVRAYAKNLGLAFQITDDILDVTATSEVLGKDVGKDQERLTFVKLAGLEGARQLNRELIETAIAALEPLGEGARGLEALALSLRDRTR